MKLFQVLGRVGSLAEVEAMRGQLDQAAVPGVGWLGTVGGAAVPMEAAGTALGGRTAVKVAAGTAEAVSGTVASRTPGESAPWEAWQLLDADGKPGDIVIVRYVGFGARTGAGSYVVATGK